MAELAAKFMQHEKMRDMSAVSGFYDDQGAARRPFELARSGTIAVVEVPEGLSQAKSTKDLREPYRDETIVGVMVLGGEGEGEAARAKISDVVIDKNYESEQNGPHEVAEHLGDFALRLEDAYARQGGAELPATRTEEIFAQIGELAGLEGYELDQDPITRSE